MASQADGASARAQAAVLCSGGLDSAVLLAVAAKDGRVLPVYVRVGVAWEEAEQRMLERVLAAPVFAGRVDPLVRLEVTARDLYPPGHWALEGQPPAYDTADEEVYLPGRNVMLLSKAGILVASRGIPRLAVGPLAGNPFPDATPVFFDAMARALSLGLAHELRIDAPFLGFHKADVIRLGLSLGVPLELTLSCMQPAGAAHCGLCSKCRERRDAFEEAGVRDPTPYRAPSPRR
jgi:7-cyano-7-deazaguanine synthase